MVAQRTGGAVASTALPPGYGKQNDAADRSKPRIATTRTRPSSRQGQWGQWVMVDKWSKGSQLTWTEADRLSTFETALTILGLTEVVSK